MVILYHPDVLKLDIKKLPSKVKERCKKVIENKLMADPLHYSKPLRKSLKGYRKVRVGNYRIILRIVSTDTVKVLAILNRDVVCQTVSERYPLHP
jgi:mRNA interferase RelE/StbE